MTLFVFAASTSILLYPVALTTISLSFFEASIIGLSITTLLVMMISESISSGKQVTTIYPANFKCPERYSKQINSYLDKGFIQRSEIGQDLRINSSNSQNQDIEISRSRLRKSILENLKYH